MMSKLAPHTWQIPRGCAPGHFCGDALRTGGQNAIGDHGGMDAAPDEDKAVAPVCSSILRGS